MAQRRRWKLSAEQRSDLWKRWRTGESLHAIGRALGKEHHVIHFLLARHGGIAPPVRRRCLRALTLAEREDISRGIASGLPMREIAKGLQRAVSTVSRDVGAPWRATSLYRAHEADQQTWDSALRPKVCLLATHRKLQEIRR
jgi:IS30 family transposase